MLARHRFGRWDTVLKRRLLQHHSHLTWAHRTLPLGVIHKTRQRANGQRHPSGTATGHRPTKIKHRLAPLVPDNCNISHVGALAHWAMLFPYSIAKKQRNDGANFSYPRRTGVHVILSSGHPRVSSTFFFFNKGAYNETLAIPPLVVSAFLAWAFSGLMSYKSAIYDLGTHTHSWKAAYSRLWSKDGEQCVRKKVRAV
jgi:hypothetical protein